MYKLLCIILSGVLGVLGVFYLIENYRNSKHERELNNKIANLEEIVKETETAYSKKAVEIDGIKSENKELQSVIKSRDEKIVSLTKLNLKLKDELLEGNNAKESEETGEQGKRERVDFENVYPSVNPFLRFTGHTLTNPAHSSVYFKWERSLNLNVIVAYDKKTKTFRSYIDSNHSDIVPTDINFQMDPDVLGMSWYEKVAVLSGVSIGKRSGAIKLGLMYDVLNNVSFGPSVMLGFGSNYEKYYGADVMWYLFR